jgi:hypothetical protein
MTFIICAAERLSRKFPDSSCQDHEGAARRHGLRGDNACQQCISGTVSACRRIARAGLSLEKWDSQNRFRIAARVSTSPRTVPGWHCKKSMSRFPPVADRSGTLRSRSIASQGRCQETHNALARSAGHGSVAQIREASEAPKARGCHCLPLTRRV